MNPKLQANTSADISADSTPDTTTDFITHMNTGVELHAASQPELALAAFEKALALAPHDLDAISACATLLMTLDRPKAAYRLLLTAQAGLLQSADGAANLGIAAESCGDLAQAQGHYKQALALEPQHLRALNNLAVMASREGTEDSNNKAIFYARRCLEISPQQHFFWLNLSDFLTSARQFEQALAHLERGLQHFPDSQDLAMRRAIVLALAGEFEPSRQALAALPPEILKQLEGRLPNPRLLYIRSAFEAMQTCDWQESARLADTLRQVMANCQKTGQALDLREARQGGITLGLHETELAQLCDITHTSIINSQRQSIPAFVARPARADDGRIHVGLNIQSLREPRFATALARQLALHDQTRFCLHLYSPTPQPQEYLVQALNAPSVRVAEMAHMSTAEAVARIRHDRLDVFVDMTAASPWHRPEILASRVAPVQVCQPGWHRHTPPQLCEYTLSDCFVHPDPHDLARFGAIVRFPHTCWLDACADEAAPERPRDELRADLGISKTAFVLCAFLPAAQLDPQTFAIWMQMLHALPHAVLWLPSFEPKAQHRLRQEAVNAGIESARLVFSAPLALSRPKTLAQMRLADLFVDSLRFNASSGLVDALRLGVPAIACAGNSMASRLGGSIIRAAGLPDCVFDKPDSYLAAAIQLGQNPGQLVRLTSKLLAARPTAALFDAQARVREHETAWTVMAERARSGQPPTSFDVPAT